MGPGRSRAGRGAALRSRAARGVDELTCKPSSVPRPRPGRRSSIWARRSPAGSERPTRGLGGAPFTGASSGIALLFGLAPGRACRVSPRPVRAGLVSVALVLASRRTGVTRYPAPGSSDFPRDRPVSQGFPRPSGRLVDVRSLPAAGEAQSSSGRNTCAATQASQIPRAALRSPSGIETARSGYRQSTAYSRDGPCRSTVRRRKVQRLRWSRTAPAPAGSTSRCSSATRVFVLPPSAEPITAPGCLAPAVSY